VTEYWNIDSISTAIPPTSTSDIMGQENKIGGSPDFSFDSFHILFFLSLGLTAYSLYSAAVLHSLNSPLHIQPNTAQVSQSYCQS